MRAFFIPKNIEWKDQYECSTLIGLKLLMIVLVLPMLNTCGVLTEVYHVPQFKSRRDLTLVDTEFELKLQPEKGWTITDIVFNFCANIAYPKMEIVNQYLGDVD